MVEASKPVTPVGLDNEKNIRLASQIEALSNRSSVAPSNNRQMAQQETMDLPDLSNSAKRNI